MASHARSRARSWALHLLYAWEIGGDGSLTEHARQELSYRRMAPRYASHVERLLQEIEAHISDIDGEIARYTANWRLERLDAIDRNVLRIGIVELRFLDDVPPKVAITEAVRLATRYGGADSPGFVNGVLDAVYKRTEPVR